MINEDELYERVKKNLYNLTGITLCENKDVMITNRLDKLKRNIKFNNSNEELLKKIENSQYQTEFVNAFTTNKTNFFREEFHFLDFKNRILKEKKDNLKIFCCASSSGEEPYSIAITLKDSNNYTNSHIIATDIDTDILNKAQNGIYKYNKTVQEFPSWLKINKYFKKKVGINIDNNDALIKINSDIKKLITFAKLNLNDDTYPFNYNEFDVIFCRNVLIYFSLEDQNIILKKLFKYLKIGGTLYLGHSESAQDLISYVNKVDQNTFIKIKEI